jgi:hypothetical protein
MFNTLKQLEGLLGDALHGLGNYQESAEHYANALITYEKHYSDNKSPEKIEYIGASHLIAHNFLKEKNFKGKMLTGIKLQYYVQINH